MDRLRGVDEETRATEKWLYQQVLFVGLLRPHLQRIDAQGREGAIPARLSRGDRRAGRDEVLRRVDVHGRLSVEPCGFNVGAPCTRRLADQDGKTCDRVSLPYAAD